MVISNNKQRNQKIRIREVDILRGLAIILMITGHSFIVHPIDIHDIPWCVTLHKWIYAFHMELFFLLAGCVYYCSSYKTYLEKKIDRLLIPYFFFGLITLLLHSSGLEAVNRQFGFTEGLLNLLMHGGSYWFIYVLFEIYLIYPFIERVFSFCGYRWLELCMAIGSILILEIVKLPNVFEIYRLVYYLPYFVLGKYLIKLLHLDIVNNNKLNVGLFSGSLVIYIVIDKCLLPNIDFMFLRYIRAVMMILFVYVWGHYLLQWSDMGSKIARKFECFLKQCSTYSLQLYLFNGFILVITRTVLVSIMHIHNPVVIVCLIVAANLIFTLSICYFILPKTKWLAWLCGAGKRPFG